LRLFIAVNLPDEIKSGVARKLLGLKAVESGIKWVEPQNLHITLKFLGWTDDKNVDQIIRISEDQVKNIKKFRVSFRGWGGFPAGKHPRVLWIGIDKDKEELKDLADSLEEAFSKEGFKSEKREFSAHLTVGRVKENKGVDKVLDKMSEMGEIDFGSFLVGSIDLMKSTLTRSGPIYEVVSRKLLR